MSNMRAKPYVPLVLVVIIGSSLLSMNITLSVNLSYEYSFIDEFDNLDNWINSILAPYTVGSTVTRRLHSCPFVWD